MFGIGIYEVRRSENQTSQCHFHIRIHLKWSEVVAARQHIPFRMEEDRGRLGQIGGDGERESRIIIDTYTYHI